MDVTDEKRRKALAKYRRLDEQAEALRLRSLDLHRRYRDAIQARREAEQAVAEEGARLDRLIPKRERELDPRLVREAEETAAEVPRLEKAYAEAQEVAQRARQLVDRCRSYLIDHAMHPDAPFLRRGREDPNARSRGAERVAFQG